MIRVLELAEGGSGLRPAGPGDLAPPGPDGPPLRWVDVDLTQAGDVAAVGRAFAIHPLALEDVRERGQRQKAERYPGHIFIAVHDPYTHSDRVAVTDLYLAVGERWVVSFHAGPALCIEAVADRVVGRTDLAANGGMAVVAALLDRVVDGYEQIVTALEEQVSRREEQVLAASRPDPVPDLREASVTRRRISRVRREASQLRELIGVLVRQELMDSGHTTELDLELRDVFDHVQRALDDLGILHDRMTSLAETRLAMVAYRQNEITKRLSAWGAILLVPTVITGWFGMNFTHMPGIEWYWGALATALTILGLCGGLFLVFRRSGWL